MDFFLPKSGLRKLLRPILLALVVLAANGCGGGGGSAAAPVVPAPVATDPALDIGNSTAFAAVLHPIPVNADGGASTVGTGAATSMTVHYQRTALAPASAPDYTGWQLYTWGVSASAAWPTLCIRRMSG